jgi:hypothetical protein
MCPTVATENESERKTSCPALTPEALVTVMTLVDVVKVCCRVFGERSKFPDSVKLLKSVITAALAEENASAKVARLRSFLDFMVFSWGAALSAWD